MLNGLQKATAQAIVNIFETGSARGDYANITLIPGDPGHLTYGRSQTTLASGNLYLLIKAYCDNPDAEFADGLRPFLSRIAKKDLTLDRNTGLRSLLRSAGSDPVMRTSQDAFFDRVYWNPAVAAARSVDVNSPLGTAVVYDSTVHGSWGIVRDRVIKAVGKVDSVGEDTWIAEYVKTRRNWLATHPNPVLHPTVYRMDAFNKLIQNGNWMLSLAITVRGVVIDEGTFGLSPSAHNPAERLLQLEDPHLSGDDVSALQKALAAAGYDVEIDGDFGENTRDAVEAFQRDKKMVADGIVGPATRSALRID